MFDSARLEAFPQANAGDALTKIHDGIGNNNRGCSS
jgi:hypothetical protein